MVQGPPQGGSMWVGRQGGQYPLESLTREAGLPPGPPRSSTQLLRDKRQTAAQTDARGPRGSLSRSAPHWKPEGVVT